MMHGQTKIKLAIRYLFTESGKIPVPQCRLFHYITQQLYMACSH